ncbi:MAG: hypothetical protein COB69_04570 [Phycisphaera sp.]|nr:MAG: hypothetical protein COB69_04570 [Phycisphaera sp.]
MLVFVSFLLVGLMYVFPGSDSYGLRNTDEFGFPIGFRAIFVRFVVIMMMSIFSWILTKNGKYSQSLPKLILLVIGNAIAGTFITIVLESIVAIILLVVLVGFNLN